MKIVLTNCSQEETDDSKMRNEQQPKRVRYRVRDRVMTARGEGIIKHVFPRGPHGKKTYAVDLGNTRHGVIFHEDEIAPVSGAVAIQLA